MRSFFTLVFLLVCQCIFSQTIAPQPFNTKVDKATQDHLKAYSVLAMDPASVRQKLDGIPGHVKRFQFRTPNQAWSLELYEYQLLAPNVMRRTASADSPLPKRTDFRTFKGTVSGKPGTFASLTLADGFFKLMVNDGQETYFVEPLNKESLSENIPSNNQFLLYKSSDVNPVEGVTCGADLLNDRLNEGREHIKNKPQIEERAAPCLKCVEVQIALAADLSMYSKYGSVAATENQMLSILADVQTVFDNEFANEYQYQVTGMWVADDPMRDPWNNVRDINTQLDVFVANAPTLFAGVAYEVATNWTAKYISGVIGLAYLSQVCNLLPFNVCSDFLPGGGRQGNYLTLQAHELGHNWSMTHDPDIARTIMAPVVNGSSQWSFQSVFQLNNYVGICACIESGCLSICPGSDAPTADFASDVTYGCQPLTVHFQNLSQFTDEWEWSFPGGTPASSSLQHPTVVYRVAGLYEVTLKARNSRCEAEVTKIGYIEVNDVPIASFSFGLNGREVFFIDQSTRADEYFWDFGDGSTSDEANPIHVYDRDSTYTVTFKVKNDCGMHQVKKTVSIVSIPVADFESDTTGGCAPKIIKFFDKSTNNVKTWQWEFEGGSPSISKEVNPVVRYDNPGVYDVRLTVYATKFKHAITKKLYVNIDSLPDADFTFNAIGSQVDFTNIARYAKSHFWNFGDGNTSTAPNPSHNYSEGRYDVMYVSFNGCGSDTAYAQVTIGQKPIAGFQVNNQMGCIPYQVQFQNTSTAAAKSFRWYFPGGNPSTSTDQNPLVTYDTPGNFDVSLVAYNPLYSDSVGVDDFIEVSETPSSAFAHAITGFKASFTNQSVGANNYFWDFGDNQISFEKEPAHEYGAEGEFNVRLVAQNECGWDTFDKKIAVYLIPKVNYAADTLRGCAPLTVQFLDRSSIDVIEWDWQFENGSPAISNLQNPKVVFNKPGKYTVKLTVRNTNGTNALTRLQYIQVLSSVLCPEHPKGDKTLVNSEIIEPPVQDEDATTRANLKDSWTPAIAPNPSNGLIAVWTGAKPESPVQMTIFNLDGLAVHQAKLTKSVTNLQLQHLAAGNYIVKFNSTKQTHVVKLLLL